MSRKGIVPVAIGLLVVAFCPLHAGTTSNENILSKDTGVVTLYSGKMTKGNRSSPVLQLECVEGGTARCDAFVPFVVQCYNRGYEGVDAKWECKAHMDNAYRFGNVEVSCEGFDENDDLSKKESCNLKYSLNYTEEGLAQKQRRQSFYSGSTMINLTMVVLLIVVGILV